MEVGRHFTCTGQLGIRTIQEKGSESIEQQDALDNHSVVLK